MNHKNSFSSTIGRYSKKWYTARKIRKRILAQMAEKHNSKRTFDSANLSESEFYGADRDEGEVKLNIRFLDW